ncbi:MAG TPA: hypothetical protein VN894_18215 [Polyangiaceae bacterium]|nr:hypothetical protein [Polyangiaceae bacterium]
MTTNDSGHVSAFTLDVFWASGRPRDSAIGEHIASCGRCRAYLATLDALRGAGPPTGPPLRGALPSSRPRVMGIGASWGWLAAGAVALAASVSFFLARGWHPAKTRYVAAKGVPGVQVLVHREGGTHVWDGRSPVRPGDSLALRVACEGLEHVAVASPGPTAWARLSNAACPRQGEPLPFTLVVDAEPGDERLAVVLSREQMDDRGLRRAIAEARRTEDVWVADFILPKETDR